VAVPPSASGLAFVASVGAAVGAVILNAGGVVSGGGVPVPTLKATSCMTQ
jgi:hypothetical protein